MVRNKFGNKLFSNIKNKLFYSYLEMHEQHMMASGHDHSGHGGKNQRNFLNCNRTHDKSLK